MTKPSTDGFKKVVGSDLNGEPREYLLQLKMAFGKNIMPQASLLLTYGRPFEHIRPLPKDVEPGQAKMCFRNAFIVAAQHPRKYYYCEGIANWKIPTEHAWVADRFGNCYDPTWDGPFGKDDADPRQYFGVAFKLAYVSSVLVRSENYGVLWNAEDSYRLARGLDNIKEVIAKGVRCRT